ncbi:MAG: hypothetical protein A6D91_12045 [Bacillaceae bacterium G1]|nr:MAG: hypothetical protein A6D91_12045 [Bacillaceae bacterium G1]
MSNEKALAVIENFGFPVANTAADGMDEEMEGLQESLEFDRVKIPSGGGLMFEVPSDNPDEPEMVKELVGVIVDHHPVNAYWPEQYSGQGNPPACSSLDGKVGIGNPGGVCKNCPYNQWGSDPSGSGGKACKNMHRIYLLRQGEMFPLLLTLPPTSIKPFSNYIAKRVVGRSKRSYSVVTKITLKREQNKNGISYSQAQFSVAGELSPEETAKAAEYAKGIKAITRTIGVEAADLASERPTNDVPFDADDEDQPF